MQWSEPSFDRPIFLFSKIDALSDHIAKFGKVSYGLLDNSTPFLRNYKFSSFDLFKKLVDDHFSSFQALQVLDFGGLLLGDEKVAEIVAKINRWVYPGVASIYYWANDNSSLYWLKFIIDLPSIKTGPHCTP